MLSLMHSAEPKRDHELLPQSIKNFLFAFCAWMSLTYIEPEPWNRICTESTERGRGQWLLGLTQQKI